MITTAYILAGGTSRRMGQDKLFLALGQTTLLAKGIATCRELFELVKIAGGSVDKFKPFDCPVVTDYPGAQGPLAGIIAALNDCAEQACFVTAADLCDLDTEIISRLLDEYDSQSYCGLVETGGIQPLCGIYNKSALPHLLEMAKRGQYGMRSVIAGLPYKGVEIDLTIWRNINRLSDFEKKKRKENHV